VKHAKTRRRTFVPESTPLRRADHDCENPHATSRAADETS
jgi:hypothetical protein